MQVDTKPPAAGAARKRKAHTKSRKGCGNCKLRRTKCDEGKPSCAKCLTFGVSCSYGHKATPGEGVLQFSANGSFHLDVLPSPSMTKTVLGAVNTSFKEGNKFNSKGFPSTWKLTSQELDVLSRFHSRTIMTLSPLSVGDLYQRESLRLACIHPFLMHLALSLTMMHDRYLLSSKPPPPSITELSHLHMGTVMFNKTLSGPMTASERDAIWGAATLLGSYTFAQIEADVPEQAWPLCEPSERDLDWLVLYEGKREIWRIADPTRPESCFRPTAIQSLFMKSAATSDPALQALPCELTSLLGLQKSPPSPDNPYRVQADILNNLMTMESGPATILCFLSFVSNMPPIFRHLIQEKDPYALLLLAYWYAKFSQSQNWNIWRRCILEGQAICIYLEKNHGDIQDLDIILEFPRNFCGLYPAQKRCERSEATGSEIL